MLGLGVLRVEYRHDEYDKYSGTRYLLSVFLVDHRHLDTTLSSVRLEYTHRRWSCWQGADGDWISTVDR